MLRASISASPSTAQAISNSVQLIARFDDETRQGTPSAAAAARASARNLFKPSMLAIVADAGCVLVVALTPIPLLQKIGINFQTKHGTE